MAYCSKCGKELEEGQKFCSGCGENLTNQEEASVEHIPLCYKIFGYVGFGLGILTFVLGFIPFANYMCIFSGPAGIVFSCLGKKEPQVYNKAIKGFKFSIGGLIIGVVLLIIYTIIFVVILGLTVDNVYNDYFVGMF